MPKVTLTPSFNKDLNALKQGNPGNYRKATAILLELQRDEPPSAHQRPDGRIPNAVKFELSSGYRLVLQAAGDAALIALAVGTHERVDAFLDGHKGYVFDPRSGRLKELRLATATDVAVEVVPNAGDQATGGYLAGRVRDDAEEQGPLFVGVSRSALIARGIPESEVNVLQRVVDPNSLECMQVLGAIEEIDKETGDLLLAFATGNTETRETVRGVFDGFLKVKPVLTGADIEAITGSPEEFVVFDDPAELEKLIERTTFQEWQVFLHPLQKALVDRRFEGPARLRGISGSGKTVVALHRARRLAQKLASLNERVLFTTHNRSLSQTAFQLLNTMCGPEKDAIEVTHLHRWCGAFLDDCGGQRPKFAPNELRQAKGAAWYKLSQSDKKSLENVGKDYVWDEIDFILGRFLDEDVDQYLHTDRAGRGRALSPVQRRSILTLYQLYMHQCNMKGVLEPAEFVREALRLVMGGRRPARPYAAVLVDEVQDFSELGLKLMHSLVGNRPDGLLLVGDATQRIHTRGFALSGLGIDITGRSIVLRKNYRNTRQILEAAFPLVQGEWEQDARAAGLNPDDLRPEYSTRDGSRPIVVRCSTKEDEIEFVAREVGFLLNYDDYQPGDICVMGWNAEYRKLIQGALSVRQVPAVEVGMQTDPTANAVRISTVHNSKGQEYAAVFILGFAAGVFPPPTSTMDDAEAERAVLYVGMTRARDILYLSYPDLIHGKAAGPSPLLRDIGPRCDHYQYRSKKT